MRIRIAACIAIVGLMSGIRLLAHHSFAAEFDGTKPIRLTGALIPAFTPVQSRDHLQ